MTFKPCGEGTWQTESGRPVRIYAVEEHGAWPIHGAFLCEAGAWTALAWNSNGKTWDERKSLVAVPVEKPPTEPGYYWCTAVATKTRIVTQVAILGGKLVAWKAGYDSFIAMENFENWSGPIEEQP